MNHEIITTSDGSRTIHLTELDEHYHSIYGARTESQHIYIENALQRRLKETHGETLQLLEVGFGTGLNTLLTLMYYLTRPKSFHIKYITYELYPLDEKIIMALFQDVLPNDEWIYMQKIHDAVWEEEVEISRGFTLLKVQSDLTQAHLRQNNDIIYLDAFAPDKSPELWSPSFLRSLYQSASTGAWLSTYCAKGVVRRTLQEVGFDVYRREGPPNGKREILTCKKL